MTIDSLMIQPERYKSVLHEKVFREGLEVYGTLALQKGLVRKNELVGFVFSDIYTDTRDEMVIEAIEREDYKLFGMTKEEFTTKVYSGQLEDVAVNPYIRQSEFEEAIRSFLDTLQLMVIDLNGEVEHLPLQEVW